MVLGWLLDLWVPIYKRSSYQDAHHLPATQQVPYILPFSFISTGHLLESFGKREHQLRIRLHSLAFGQACGAFFLIDD